MLEAEAILQNRYQLKQKLGDNTARQTWLAIDLESPDNSQVVVKLLAFGGQIQWENLKLFEREAQVLKQLDHPHIPKYRDYFCIDDRLLWFALVEDYIPGASLKELLAQKQRFTEKQVTKIAVDILNILLYLHQLNPPVLHRDIKPSNLILGEDEQIYLVDFGAVQDKAAKEGATFTVVGTYGYTPIEQFGGKAVPASDLYALGATLIHLLTGTAPADLPQRDLRIIFSDKVSLSSTLVHWIEKLTEPAPERRFIIASQALEILETPETHNQLIHRSDNEKISCPYGTRIELHKSPLTLQIKIKPLHKIKSSPIIVIGLFLLSSLCIFMLPFLFESPVGVGTGLISCIVLITFIAEYSFSTTEVDFDRDGFEIKKQIFNRTYLKQAEVTSNIRDVSIAFSEGTSTGVIIILNTLHTVTNTFAKRSFGGGLTDAEIIWLAQEIREWLELQKQREAKH